MSKAPSQNLFDLIRSLSKSEKRHFKVFSSRHVIGEENKYVNLFDVVDSQSSYDEKKILKKAGITKQQLKKWKKYLYELILKSVHIFTWESDAERKISNLLIHTKILFGKGLYQQCLNLLTKAKQLAGKYEKHLLLFEILGWEETVFRRMYNIKDLEKYIAGGFKERKHALKKMITINEYRNLYAQQYLLSNKEWLTRTTGNARKWNIIVSHPLMKNEKPATSYEARVWYYFIKGNNEGLKLETTYPILKKRIVFIEQHPHQIADDPYHYVYALLNFAFACNELGKNKEFINAMEKLRKTSIKTIDLQNKVFTTSYHLQSSHYIKNGQFQKGIELIDEIQKGFYRFGDVIDKHLKLLLQFNISIMCFAAEDYHSASRWLNIILNDSEKDLRKDIYCFARILNLIIHYEMGHPELLESAVKSTRRFLNKRKRLYVLETSVLDFFRKKLPNINMPAQPRVLGEAFEELKQEITEITKKDFEKKALDYFDIISWIESKIENRSFAEIVREKAKSC